MSSYKYFISTKDALIMCYKNQKQTLFNLWCFIIKDKLKLKSGK